MAATVWTHRKSQFLKLRFRRQEPACPKAFRTHAYLEVHWVDISGVISKGSYSYNPC